MIQAIFATVFISVVGLTYALLAPWFSEERQVSKRLERLSDYELSQAKEAEPLLVPFKDRIVKPLRAGLGSTVRSVAPQSWLQDTRRRLILAGIKGLEAERFVAARFIGAISTLLFFVAISAVVTFRPLVWLMVLLLCLFAYFLPSFWLTSRVESRQAKIRRQLPDMLDMLTISVEAGLGFDGALAKLIQNTSGPMPEEFARVLQEVQAGIDRSVAMRHLSERTEVPELDAFIMAIVQAEVFGISVSQVLRQQAAEMRIRRRQYAEEQAQKAPVRLVFPLVICILPATLIVILGPAIIRIAGVFG